MEIISKSDWLEILSANGSTGNKILKTNGNEIVQLSLIENAEIPIHTLPFDVLFYIEKGNPILLNENDTFQCSEKQTVLCNKNEPRGWENNNKNQAEILVIKFMEKI